MTHPTTGTPSEPRGALVVVASADAARRAELVGRLRRAGHAVVGTAAEGAETGPSAPDLLLVDGALPVARVDRLRAQLGPDAVASFARGETADAIVARVAGALRGTAELVRLDAGAADPRRRAVYREEGAIALTERESALLAWLARRPDRVWSRDELLREVWGWRAGGETRTVDTTVRRLREKIEVDPSRPRHILTVVGEGYRWAPPASPHETPSAPPGRADSEGGGRPLAAPPGPAAEPSPPAAREPDVAAGEASEVLDRALVAHLRALLGGPEPRLPAAAPHDEAVLLADLVVPHDAPPAETRDALLATLADALADAHAGRRVFRPTGYAWLFPRAADALDAAAAWHRALAARAPALGEAVGGRAALHVGEVRVVDGSVGAPLRVDGLALPAAERLLTVALPGQTLVSRSAWELTRHLAGTDARSWVGHGRYVVTGALDAIEVFEVGEPGSAPLLPPPTTARARRVGGGGRLPAEVSSFVGRAELLGQVHAALDAVRLVSLVGPGGAGKTRLSVRVAESRSPRDGAWFVDLSPLSSSDQVPAAVAAALAVPDVPGRPVAAVLQEHVRAWEALVVLDNCEHVLPGVAPLVAQLMRAGGGLRVLTTSREAVGLPGERILRVTTLELPAEGASFEQIAASEAVRLFVERVVAQQAAFRLTEQNAPVVAAICRRLDGIPLALELAAARARAMPVEHLAARLGDRFRTLAGGHGALPRHQTLDALIRWSHDLLQAPERAVFRRLAVFVGGWTLEGAEAVCAGDGVEPWDVVDALTALVDKSLVHYTDPDGRYHFLETVRAFAANRLAESGDGPGVAERHASWWTALAERCDPQGPDARACVDRLDTDRDNVRAAVDWLVAHRQPGAALACAQNVAVALRIRGRNREATAMLEVLEVHTRGQVDAHRASMLVSLGLGRSQRGDFPGARGLLAESLAIRRALGDARGVVNSLFNLGDVLRREGALDEALLVLREAVAEGASLGRRLGLIQNLGAVQFHRGELVEARALLEEELALEQASGHAEWEAETRAWLARVALAEGSEQRAAAHVRKGVALARELDYKHGILMAAFAAALLARHRQDSRRAAQLLAAQNALGAAVGARRDPVDAPAEEAATRIAEAEVGVEGVALARADGARWDWDQLCDAILAVCADAG